MTNGLKCKYCGRANFTKKFALTNHEKSCVTKQRGEFQCPQCGRADFSSRSGLMLHMEACVASCKMKSVKDSKTGEIINQIPEKCNCPSDVKEAKECWISPENCWVDGWGWCTYASKNKVNI